MRDSLIIVWAVMKRGYNGRLSQLERQAPVAVYQRVRLPFERGRLPSRHHRPYRRRDTAGGREAPHICALDGRGASAPHPNRRRAMNEK